MCALGSSKRMEFSIKYRKMMNTAIGFPLAVVHSKNEFANRTDLYLDIIADCGAVCEWFF